MEEDYEGARRREPVLRSGAERKRWGLNRQWRMSSQGDPFINADGYKGLCSQKADFRCRQALAPHIFAADIQN
jgi:hypothetical protein